MQSRLLFALALVAATVSARAQNQMTEVRTRVNAEYANLFELYKHLHANPELSFHEEKTSARVAKELKRAGFEVTTGGGGHGVVAALKNGDGPTILVRSDLDGLPVKEQTGLPEVQLGDEFTPATFNPPELTERLAKVFKVWLGEENVQPVKPVMGGEDFSEYGRTAEKIPICFFHVGGVNRAVFDEATRAGKALPSLHSAFWSPDPEPTIKTGITAMTAAVLALMGK